MTSINRRTVLRGGAAVGAAGATFGVGVAVPKAMTGDDGQILALYRQWLALRERARVLDEQGPPAVGTARYDEIYDEVSECFDRGADIAHRIALTPASSLEGVAAKLRVMQGEAPCCCDDRPALAELETFEKVVWDGFRAVIRDVERLAGRAS